MARFGLRRLVRHRRPVCDMNAMQGEPVTYNFMRKPSSEVVEDGGAQPDDTAEVPQAQEPAPRSSTAHSHFSPSSTSSDSSNPASDSSSDDEAPVPMSSSAPQPSKALLTIPPAPPLPDYIPGMPNQSISRLVRLSGPIVLRRPLSTLSNIRRRQASPPPPSASEEDSSSGEDSSSITTKTTHNISIRSPSSSELTCRLSRLSSRMPRPSPVHIQSIKIELGDGEVYDNFEDAVEAIRVTECSSPSQAHVTVVAVGEGVWGSEVGRWVQDRPDAGGATSSSSGGGGGVGPSEGPSRRRSASLRRNSLPALTPAHLPYSARDLFAIETFGGAIPEPAPEIEVIVPHATQHCMVCMTEQNTATMFSLATTKCEHTCHTCKTCLTGWVKSNVEGDGSTYVVCPEGGCGVEMEFHDVRRALLDNNGMDDDEKSVDAAIMKAWKRYEKQCLHNYLSTLDNFLWCLSPSCEGGQVHDPSAGPVVTCVSCGFKMCAEHQIPWHEGVTCDAFDRKFSRVRNEERIYRVAIKFLGVKDCPRCRVNVQKHGGCDHMRCTNCRAEFCYRCRRDYEGPAGIWVRGKNAHSLGCRHYWGRIPWSRR